MHHIPMRSTTTVLEREYILPAPVPENPYVLVIDDEQAILAVVMLLLETEGYIGFGFSDSTKVLSFLEQLDTQHLPAVILLDLMMPIVSGYEIAAYVSQNAHYAHIPIIIMTADIYVNGA